MKYKLDMNLLYELASINVIEAEILKLKRLREKELYKMMPKELGSVDYEKERVQGGIIESEEQQILNIQCLTSQIAQQEQILNIYKETLEKKNEAIYSILTDRQRYIYDETFIKGRTCDDVSYELGIERITVIRERGEIIKKINTIKSKINTISSEIFNEMQ